MEIRSYLGLPSEKKGTHIERYVILFIFLPLPFVPYSISFVFSFLFKLCN